jgi:glycosyltransferase involved in cell wall biosynthesis
MPKVLLITDTLQNGGAERQLALLIKYLPLDWDRCIWSFHGGPFEDIIRSTGVNVIIAKRVFRFDISPAVSLWKIIKSWRPDVVHSWGWMATAAAGPLCRIRKIPLIDGTIRMGMVRPLRGHANRWSMKWASLVVANSQAGIRAWGIPSEKGRVIYNGFDPKRLDVCSEILPKLENIVKVVMTGRMVPEKDYDTFLNAARLLSNSSKYRWQFIAVGNGPDRQKLIDRNWDLITKGQVVFIAGKTDVLPLLYDAYVGVLVSHPEIHAEGCSNSLLEYMACSLPVICGESGGNREVVIDGDTGFIIPPRNPTALAEKLSLLREKPDLAHRMGVAGRERILRHFSVEKMVKGYIEAYNQARR